MNKDICAISW